MNTRSSPPSDSSARRHFDSGKLWHKPADTGFYQNPIIAADYSDPDVIRLGDDYYLTASSFNCTPGLPILHSVDLVHWQLVNHAVRRLPAERYAQVQPGCGIWAPAIRYHDGKFWIFFAMPDEGIYMTTAEHPEATWSLPHLVQAGCGLIDPCPLWDDNGDAYLVHAFAHSRSGIRHRLQLCRMSPDGTHLLGSGHTIFEQPEKHPILEGPKFLKRDGWYYILAPAGGVQKGWQVALRSRSVLGPYEERTILEQGSGPINGPHQGALVDTRDGEWWFIHFQDTGPYGRVTHLQPATWHDGWPVIGIDQDDNGIGEPVLKHRKPSISLGVPPLFPQTSDEFNNPTLGLQWQWNANSSDTWYSLSQSPGWLRLFAGLLPDGNLATAPHLLSQKFPARRFTATTLMRLPPSSTDTRAGLVVMGESYAGLFVANFGGTRSIEQVTCIQGESERTLATATSPESLLWLQVQVLDDAECSFRYSADGKVFHPLGPPFAATSGRWIGARVGIVCTGRNSYVDFNNFRVD